MKGLAIAAGGFILGYANVSGGEEKQMPSSPRLVLTSFQDGRAVIEVAYGDRRARLELDSLEDLYPGQPTAERAKQELSLLVDALDGWRKDPGSAIESG